jgi:putative transposon-encoded protein
MAIDDEIDDGFEEHFSRTKVKFEIYGEEMIEKTVNSSGNSGRVYLPTEWIGKKVKVIKC